MLLSTEISVNIVGVNLRYYQNLGYNIKVGDKIIIPINYLPKTSHTKILVECDKCNSKKEVHFFAYNKYIEKNNRYLCNKCNHEIRKNTLIELYGTEILLHNNEIKEKREKTIMQKYGCDHPCKTTEVKEKIKNTNLERYGVEYPAQSSEIRRKTNITNLIKYGNINSLVNVDINTKTLKTMISKYGVKYSAQNKEIHEKIITNGLKTRQQKILDNNKDILEINYAESYYIVQCENNHQYKIDSHLYCQRKIYNIPICTICNPLVKNVSGSEISLIDLISKHYKGEISLNNRKIIAPYELDIYLPELKLGFEYNGLYWHSELYKNKKYHLEKTKNCKSKGIKLIHVWEDSWVFKKEIMSSIISNMLNSNTNRIFARKCEIRELNSVKSFLEKNHLQGNINSKVKLGLFYKDELVSIMTFGKKRLALGNKSSSNDDYELLRFCNKLYTNVIGGASKLLKYFITKYKPKEIITYADQSFSQGKLYEKLGFDLIGETQPNYYYIVDLQRKHRFNYRKDVLVKEGFDINKTEKEIMIERNILRIYDCGNLKYKLNI